MAVYTLGMWTVKPGSEDEFVTAWHQLARETSAAFGGTTAVLLRDRDHPNHFISSGPWESLEQIEAWRASALFADGVARLRDTLESFAPHTMDVAAQV